MRDSVLLRPRNVISATSSSRIEIYSNTLYLSVNNSKLKTRHKNKEI